MGEHIYAHFTAPKGAAMIINNRNFSDQPERKGTDVDCANLHNLFTQLGYRVDTRVNQTAQDMVNTVAELATCRALLTASSLVLAILSHGDEGAIYGVDGKMVYVNQLLSLLNSDHCRTMAGKPKLVFIQACRGEGRDRGVDMVDGAASLQPDARFLDLFNCTGPAQRIQTRRSRLPAETDFLIAYATPPRHVSWRNTQRGSWFVQSICEVFAKHAKDDHIMDLMTRVNDRMATFETGERFKQASEIHTRLRKHLYFFPGMTRDTAV